jgi:hypothetical protein
MEPKFNYGRKVYIKRGFYRTYTADVREFREVEVLNQKTGEKQLEIWYKVKIENVPLKDLKDGLYDVPEDWLIPYKKFWVV